MPILMHKPNVIKIICAAALLVSTGKAAAQAEELEQIGRLINDAIFFSDKYITPATDAAVYQAASGWVTSPKARDRWDFTLSVHTNVFFVPKSDRKFTIYNSDFEFFTLEEGTSASVPTALGNDEQVMLTGQLGDEEVRLKTPEGINREVVVYPYFQGSLSIGWGFEVVGKYSPKIKLKKSNYQVYGAGLKYDFGRHIKKLQENKINLSVLAAYSKEDVTFDFLNVDTSAGSLGISTLTGLVDTYQAQINASKEFGSFEVMGGFIFNVSDVAYEVGGERGSIEDLIPLQSILNKRLEEIYKTRRNYMGEASVKYNIGNFNIQSIVAFGKFVNTNISLQYLF
jgi:hypothetical protein